LLAFAQFGSDLDANTKAIIEHGARLTELLKQAQYVPMKLSHQVLSLFSAKHHFLKMIPTDKIKEYENQLLSDFDHDYPQIIEELEDKKIISKELEEDIMDAMEIVTERFIKMSAS